MPPPRRPMPPPSAATPASATPRLVRSASAAVTPAPTPAASPAPPSVPAVSSAVAVSAALVLRMASCSSLVVTAAVALPVIFPQARSIASTPRITDPTKSRSGPPMATMPRSAAAASFAGPGSLPIASAIWATPPTTSTTSGASLLPTSMRSAPIFAMSWWTWFAGSRMVTATSLQKVPGFAFRWISSRPWTYWLYCWTSEDRGAPAHAAERAEDGLVRGDLALARDELVVVLGEGGEGAGEAAVLQVVGELAAVEVELAEARRGGLRRAEDLREGGGEVRGGGLGRHAGAGEDGEGGACLVERDPELLRDGEVLRGEGGDEVVEVELAGADDRVEGRLRLRGAAGGDVVDAHCRGQRVGGLYEVG